MKIDGGYILLSRKIDESDTMRLPPATREIWLYILRKVNHSDFKNLKRGENIFTYKKIQDDLCWYAGYRKMTYTKNDIAKSIRRLHERNMIETTKATRGVVIKVVNYDVYQDPNNYEGHKEDTTKAQRKTQGVSTIYKNVYNKNKNDIPKGMAEPEQVDPFEDIPKEETKKKFGNTDINECMKYLQDKIGASLDGSVKENRQYCYNLIRKMKKDYPDTEPVDQIKMLIDVAMQDKFHSKNITGFRYLYYNTQRIAQSFKSDYGISSNNSDIEVI